MRKRDIFSHRFGDGSERKISRVVKCPTIRLLFFRGVEMTRYEWLIRAIADEAIKAGEAKKRGDVEMEKFHTNAAAGLRKKLRKLSLDEAAEVVA